MTSARAIDSFTEIATLRIELKDSDPPIWRIVEVPTSITLKVLHDIVQVTMGWLDYHLWELVIEGHGEVNTWAGEIQAGSYCLMDTTYQHAGAPFAQALTLLSTIISANAGGWFVADLGLKALGMDHGNPTMVGGDVWYFSDEHVTFTPADGAAVGERVRVIPAHVDPTMALHDAVWLVRGDDVLERWAIDLRGWD